MKEVDFRTWRDKIKQAKKEKYQEDSKRRLVNIINKHMTTTFIAALASFEEEFGYLWGHGKTSKTEKEKEYFAIWQKVRNEVLNRGNHELRGIQNELEYYIVEWLRHQTEFIMVENKDE